MKSRPIATALLLFVALSASAAEYRIIHKFVLGGEGGWDYLTLDAEARRLYIARATRVMVVDADSGKQVGGLADTPGVHGVALVPDAGLGVTSNGRENTATIFDLKTLKPITKLKTGENPDAITYDPASRYVFVMNGRSG